MADLKLTADYDLIIENGQFKMIDGYDTNIFVSIFTDQRADSADVPKPEKRRGWMINQFNADDETQIGSLLWLYEQRRLNINTRNLVVDSISKSLQWMLEQNIASDINVKGDIVPRSGIEISVKITYTNGVTSKEYIRLWEVTGI